MARLEAWEVAAVDGNPLRPSSDVGEKGEKGDVTVEPDVLGLMTETEIEFAAESGSGGGAIAILPVLLLTFADADVDALSLDDAGDWVDVVEGPLGNEGTASTDVDFDSCACG